MLAYFASKKVKIMIPLGAAACMRAQEREREVGETRSDVERKGVLQNVQDLN